MSFPYLFGWFNDDVTLESPLYCCHFRDLTLFHKVSEGYEHLWGYHIPYRINLTVLDSAVGTQFANQMDILSWLHCLRGRKPPRRYLLVGGQQQPIDAYQAPGLWESEISVTLTNYSVEIWSGIPGVTQTCSLIVTELIYMQATIPCVKRQCSDPHRSCKTPHSPPKTT